MNEAIAKLALEHYNQTGERLQRIELDWMQTHCIGDPQSYVLRDVSATVASCIDTAVNLPHNASS